MSAIQKVIQNDLEANPAWAKIATRHNLPLDEIRRRAVEEASEWWPQAVAWPETSPA